MQCIICLEEEGEDNESNENKILLLRCISSKNCTFYAHYKCIHDWHKTINQFECPICHFILPNEVQSAERSAGNTPRPANNRMRNINVENHDNHNQNHDNHNHDNNYNNYDNANLVLERIGQMELRRAESSLRRRLSADELENLDAATLRNNQNYIVLMCCCVMLLCFLATAFALINH